MKGIPAQSTSNWPSRGFHTFFPQILMYPKISWCHQVSVRYADEDSLSGSAFSEFPLLASWSHCRLESLPEWIHPILEMLGCNEVWNPFFFPSNGCVTDEGWLWSSLPLHGTCLHSSVACRSSLMYLLWLLLPVPAVSWRRHFSGEKSAFFTDGAESTEHGKGGK